MFKSKKKQQAELLAGYHEVKSGSFYFDSIRRYFLGSDKTTNRQIVSDKTYHDLDLDEVFMFIDRTVSKVGQQYYYQLFRTIPPNRKQQERLEQLIQLFATDQSLKASVVWQLSQLNSHGVYLIAALIHENHVQKPRWFWIVPVLSLFSIAVTVLSFFFPQLLILLIFVLILNYLLHYWNKTNLYQYAESVPQLLRLNQVAKELLTFRALADKYSDIHHSTKSMDRIGFRMSLFRLEATLLSEIGQVVEFIAEIAKALFLVEPLLLFSVLRKLDTRREQIDQLYRFVGELDVAISIASLRDTLPYYASPTITENRKYLIGYGCLPPAANQLYR